MRTLGLGYIDNDIKKGKEVFSYTFRGWYLEPECINAYDPSKAVTEDISVYADWLLGYGEPFCNV